jgi:hypothetical protein
MGRRSFQTYEDTEPRESRPSVRAVRSFSREDLAEENGQGEPEPLLQSFDIELMALCARFGLEAWAASDGDMGLRSFGSAVEQWLNNSEFQEEVAEQPEIHAIRLVTNLLIIVGAAVRLPQCAPVTDAPRATDLVSAARQSIGWLAGPLPSFPASIQAMQRMVAVRGWSKLTRLQQALAESLLALFLETLAVTQLVSSPLVRAKTLLLTSEAWLEVLRLAVLPSGFDERLLRATSWYLETYIRSQRG